MSIPGTADWLREKAAEVSDDFAEGLIRAANRIERLQSELKKTKTGVDQSRTPMPAMSPRGQYLQAHGKPHQNFPIYRISLPEPEFASDRDAQDRFFEWINGSENLGMGLLDPCNIFVLGEPNTEGGLWPLDTTIGISTLMKDRHEAGFIRLSGVSRKGPLGILEKHLNDVDLTGCYVIDVEKSRGETIVEIAATAAKDVKEEADDDDDE
jgi:hypothetical protein